MKSIFILIFSFLCCILNAQWSTSGSNIYYNSGKAGIGTSSPAARFQIKGYGANYTTSGFGIWDSSTITPKQIFGINDLGQTGIGMGPINDAMLEILGFNTNIYQYLLAVKRYNGSTGDPMMYIRADGRTDFKGDLIRFDNYVGIGVDNPGNAKLYVRGTTNDNTSYIVCFTDINGVVKYAIRNDGDQLQNLSALRYTVTSGVTINGTSYANSDAINGNMNFNGSNWLDPYLYNNNCNLNIYTKDALGAGKGGTIGLGGVYNGGSAVMSFANIRGGKENSSDGNRDGYMGLYVSQGTASYERMRITSAGQIGIGTSTPATSAAVDIASTTGALIITRMTTTQRNDLTAVNGMIIYNTTTSEFNFYENGSWVTK